MITVQEAEKIIFSCVLSQNTPFLDVNTCLPDRQAEGVSLQNALGRILAEDLVADRDFPPFDRVTMDGIAIFFERFKQGQTVFTIENTQAAGAPQLSLTDKKNAIEVMTGAMLPLGCDTIIRYEDLKIENGKAEILIQSIDFQQNIHRKGRDKKQNDTLILRGQRITATETATAATIGKSMLQVLKLPRVAVISTGDELVDISETPLPYQIRRSNVYAIAALLESTFKIEAQLFHFDDDKDLIFNGLKTVLSDFDVIVLSGAVSEGKFDFVPTALNDLGVEKLFHKVSQRPGKPFWFGRFQNQSVVFALPGNPVSTFMCACRYLVPFIHKNMGKNIPPQYCVLSEDFFFKPNLTYFLQVKLHNEKGVLMAKPIEGGGSGDLANLNDADGFLELPLEKSAFMKGEVYPFIGYR